MVQYRLRAAMMFSRCYVVPTDEIGLFCGSSPRGASGADVLRAAKTVDGVSFGSLPPVRFGAFLSLYYYTLYIRLPDNARIIFKFLIQMCIIRVDRDYAIDE